MTTIGGEGTVDPLAVRFAINRGGGAQVELVGDGAQWWTTDSTGTSPLAEEDAMLWFAALGILQPSDVVGLLGDSVDLGGETVLGVPTRHLHIAGVERSQGWPFGALAELDVWRADDGVVMKLVATWDTAELNSDGQMVVFVSHWEMVELNPDVAIELPL